MTCFNSHIQTVRMIRRSISLLFILAGFCAFAGTRAQDVTIKLESVDLKRAIVETEKQTSLRFLYNEATLPTDKKVNIQARRMPVNEFLGLMFQGTGVQYKIMDNNLVVLITPASATAVASDKQVEGRVTDESGNPLSGASVIVKGTQQGTITDANGKFSLKVPDDGVIQVSAVGYESQELNVAGRSDFIIILKQRVQMQEQIVVIGYGTARKKDLTGSSVSIKGSDIANLPVLTATQAIQGRAAGVQVVNSGAPGSAPTVRIRGTGSILGGVEPLYVVDGIITTDIRNINAADILTVDILKDAASTAIYGARAANGVVLITTRAGSGGKLKVKYDGQVGVRMMTHGVEMSGPNLFALYSNDAAQSPVISSADITGSTYWYDELTRPALFNNHTVSLNGGGKKYKFYGSGGYLYDNGILLDNNYKRYTLRFNHEYAATSKLKFGNNIGFSHYNAENKPYSLFSTAYIAAPIFEPYNSNGTFGNTTKSDVGNPLATLKTTNNSSWGDRLQFSLWGDYKILKNLSFRSSFGIDLEQNLGHNYVPVYQTFTPTGQEAGQRVERSSLTYIRDSAYHWTWDNFLTYDLTLGSSSKLKLVGGHTAERRDGWRNTATRVNVEDNEDQWVLNFNDTTGGQENVRLPAPSYFRRESWFVRANYSLMDRYLVNLTLRRDASSNFPESKRWGSFPSIGVGWVLSDEGFLRDNKTIDMLKLRASYGLVGNDAIAPGQFFIIPEERQFAYFGDTRINGATVVGIKDPNLQWEIVKEFNVGLDFALFNRRLTGEIDYYNKLATKALYTIPLPSVGFGNSLLTNAADVLNRGVEIALGWSEELNKNFRYSIRGNITFNHNEVRNIGLGKALYDGSLNNGYLATITDVGLPIGSFYVYKTDGIYQTQDEITSSPHFPTAQPGDYRVVDTNGDKVIDENDRIAVGSAQPKYYYGLNGSANWKKWDFALDLFGSGGNKVYNAKKGLRYGGNYNIEYDVAINRWQPGSGENKYPRAFNGTLPPMDYFVEDGSFLRINNVTVGYNFATANWKHFDRLRVYASAQNPFILTPYTGFTPEMPGTPLASGIELNIYPVTATYLIGVNLQFR